MKIDGKIKGRKTKDDHRDIRNWCGSLSFEATNEGDQYLLAALYRIAVLQGKDTKDIRDRITEVAKQCQVDHVTQSTKFQKKR